MSKRRSKIYQLDTDKGAVNVRARSEKGALSYAAAQGYVTSHDCGPRAVNPPRLIAGPGTVVINPKGKANA